MSDPVDVAELSPTELAKGLLERVWREQSTGEYERALATPSGSDLREVRANRRAGLAFWLNVYNAAAQLLLDRRPELFDSRWRFFRAKAITIAGVGLSLDDLEHGILRDRRSKYGFGYLPRLARTGIDSASRLEPDPRIHFALNCGAASCPPVLAYEAMEIDRTLDDATRSYLDQTVEYDSETDRVRLPRVCLWFLGDFGGFSGLCEFLWEFEQVPPGSNPSIRFHGYDWTPKPRKFAAER